jgi:AcrR family transcriptional regulator
MRKKTTDPQIISERLQRVVAEAEALFIQEGFLHFSTDELAERLRCSKRTLYAIAPGREKFFEAIILRRLARFQQRIAELKDAPSVEAAVSACIEASLGNINNVSPLYIRDVLRFPAGSRVAKQWQKTLGDALGQLIQRGIRENVFRRIEPRLAAEALVVSVMRVVEPDFLMDVRVTAADAVRQVYQIFWSGLCRVSHDISKIRLPAVSLSD